ncbi:hypothetical protein Ahy_A02g007090 [Arachis hypogaea]|uniref:Mandelate racemase/muconate lactonizing enzyme N-terminal domain-containing protein n=1 Tax=Arachis hypogaea TaxID=3818 RepID=A0A445EBF5_ARAHY|nr:hypothetical protein Ahy_A02g007090 [Arachis hypogaea]
MLTKRKELLKTQLVRKSGVTPNVATSFIETLDTNELLKINNLLRDINMQILVGQMYYSGYGVPKDDQKNLMETFTVDVHRAENRPLNVPLIAPFIIASSRLEMVENVAIRIELSNGSVGWGEAPILSFVIAEDQKTAMAKASEACAFLRRCPLLTLGSMLEEIAAILPGHEFATVSDIQLNSSSSSSY